MEETRKDNLSLPLSVLKEGTRVDHYEILSLLGVGGMGAVYKAMDTGMKRTVALKFISTLDDKERRATRRFLREAQICAQLDHPHIVKVYQAAVWQENPYMVMEYIEGKMLLEYVQERNCRLAEQIEILIKIAQALHHAHEKKIVHRDLKPGNIMVRENGEPVLMDFGIAKISENKERSMTKTGEVVGSLYYMAPEQAEQKRNEIDARTDVYGLGAVLYYLLTRRPPVSGSTFIEVMHRIVSGDLESPKTLVPDIPDSLDEICLTALEKKREKRFPSAAQFADALRSYLEGKHSTSGSRYVYRRKLQRLSKVCRSNAKMVWGGFFLLVFLMTLGAGAWSLRKWREEKKAEAVLNQEQGKQLYERKKYQEAIVFFQKSRDDDPAQSEAHLYLGLCHEELGQMEEAAKAYEKAYDRGREHLPVLYRKGLFHLRQKEYEKARKMFDLYVEKSPDDFAGYKERSRAFEGTGNLEKANEDRLTAGRMESKRYAQKALSSYAAGNEHRALEEISQAIELYPCSEYHFQKGKWLLAAGYPEDAYRYLSPNASEEESDRLECMAKCAEGVKKYEEAYLLYDRLYRKSQAPRFYLRLGRSAFYCNRHEEAMDFLNRAISCETLGLSEKGEALFYRGMLLKERNETERAEQDWNMAFQEGDKHRLDILYRLARLCLERGKTRQAVGYLEKALAYLAEDRFSSIDPLQIHLPLAEGYFQMGEYARAIESFSKCISIRPWEYDFFYKRGICAGKIQRYEEAEKDFSICLKLKPEEFAPYIHLIDNTFQEGILVNFMKLHLLFRLALRGIPISMDHDLFAPEKFKLAQSLIGTGPSKEELPWDEKKYRVLIKGLTEANSPAVHDISEMGLLSMYSSPRLYEELEEILRKESGEVKGRIERVITKVVSRWKPSFCRFLLRYCHLHDSQALNEMYHKGRLARACLYAIVNDPKVESIVRFWSAKSLADLRQKEADHLLKQGTQEKDPITRMFCEAVRLGAGFPLSSPDSFRQAMSIEESYVRTVLALYTPMDQREILEALLSDKDVRVKAYAAARLISHGNTSAEKELRKGFQHEDHAVRAFCLSAYWNLSAIKDASFVKKMRSHVPALIEALKDPHPYVRRVALVKLDSLEEEEHTEFIARCLKDSNNLARLSAITCLSYRQQYERVIPFLLDSTMPWVDRTMVAATFSAVVQNPKEFSLPYLFNLCSRLEKDPDPRIRILIFIKIGWFRAEFFDRFLLSKSSSPDEAVRMGCVIAMHNQRNPRFLKRLEEMLSDREEKIRNMAAAALVYVTGANDMRELSSLHERFMQCEADEIKKGASFGYARLVYNEVRYPDETNEKRWDFAILYDRFIQNMLARVLHLPWDSPAAVDRKGPRSLSQCIECLSMSLQLNDTSAHVWFERGVLHYAASLKQTHLKRFYLQKSVDDLEKAFKKSPKELYRKWLVFLYTANGEPGKALPWVEEMLHDSPWDQEMWKVKARALELLDRLEESREAMERLEYLKKR